MANDNIVINIYLGSFNVADVAQRYIKCVEYILQEINKRNPILLQIPWIVNTMGFNRGLGINLLKKCMNLIQPTTFIEIKSRFSRKNFECSLQSFCTQHLEKCNYMNFQAVPESDVKDMNSHDFWGIPEAYKLRDIVILSFLGERFPKSIQDVTPYCISLDDIKIQLLQCDKMPQSEEEILSILNMSLVSLGTINQTINNQVCLFKTSEIVESKGFGLVRAVDPVKRLIYVMTDCDFNPEVLETINCLTSGSINLPNGVFLTKISNKLKKSPYVEAKPQLETPLNIPWQRSGKPRLNEFQQNRK